MSKKKLRRAAKVLAGLGAAYVGSKMLGKKPMEKVDMKAVYEDMPTPKSKPSIMPKAKPAVTSARPKKFMGINFGTTSKPSNLEAFKEAERQRRIKTGFGRNVGKRSTSNFGLDPFGPGMGAKTGKFVTTKCKLGRNKKTKLS